MNGKTRFTQQGFIAPGDTYHLHGRLHHFVGTLRDGDVLLYVSWRYNRYSQQRVYVTQPRWAFEIDMQYAV